MQNMTKYEATVIIGLTTLMEVLYWFAVVTMFLAKKEWKGAHMELDAMKSTIDLWKDHLNKI